jgi:hypothetical protein
MMSVASWALLSPDWPVKILAAVGGATLGALVFGWLVRLVAKLVFVQQVPPTALNIVRGMGGVACGLIVWSLLGPNLGPGKGPGEGPGKGPGDGSGRSSSSTTTMDEQGKPSDKNTTTGRQKSGKTLVVEVLGDDPLREIARKQGSNFDREHRYRITEGGKKVLKTREEIEKIVKQEHANQSEPLVALAIKVYKDTPARDTWVVPLEQFASKLSTTKEAPLKVTQEIESGYAPVD